MTRETEYRQLARAVEKLTRPYVVSHVQRMPGGGRRTVTTTHSPLIIMLATAGTPSLGSAGAAASERVPVDDGAQRLIAQLTDDIFDLWEELAPAITRLLIRRLQLTPEELLIGWWRLFDTHARHDFTIPPYAPGSTGSIITDDDVQHALGVCQSWVETIEQRLDPPPSIEGTIECPECGRRWARSTIGDRVASITITFGGTLATSSAVCRACGATWVGRRQLEDLAAGRSRRPREQTAQHADRDA